MILAAYESLYDKSPSEWFRRVEISVLMRAFSRAFEVDQPELGGLAADDALEAFREFTATCMEAAGEDDAVAKRYRERLGDEALRLGTQLRRMLAVRRSQAFRVARFLYRGIQIEIAGELPGDIVFGPCSFAGRYTPGDCWFMSAFDEGFLRGISGNAQAKLVFSRRLTQGAPCCRACLGKTVGRGVS